MLQGFAFCALTYRSARRVFLDTSFLTWRCIVELILAGTGHRPGKLGGYGDDVQNALVELAMHSIEHLKPSVVISGMALGWDQALATAALLRQVNLIAAVPFANQHQRWPLQSRETYHSLLRKADEIVYVDQELQLPLPGEYLIEKMHARNEWMVDRCHRVLALWNGDTSGGTAACVAYAQRIGRPVSNAWSAWINRFAPNVPTGETEDIP